MLKVIVLLTVFALISIVSITIFFVLTVDEMGIYNMEINAKQNTINNNNNNSDNVLHRRTIFNNVRSWRRNPDDVTAAAADYPVPPPPYNVTRNVGDVTTGESFDEDGVKREKVKEVYLVCYNNKSFE